MPNRRFLQVSSYDGRLIAGYLTFGRRPGDTSVRISEPELGLVVDFAADGRPIGLEITAPGGVTLAEINRVLILLGQPPATLKEFTLLFSNRDGAHVDKI